MTRVLNIETKQYSKNLDKGQKYDFKWKKIYVHDAFQM